MCEALFQSVTFLDWSLESCNPC